MQKSGQHTTHSYVEHRKTRAVEFGILDPEDITKISVANINSERIYNEVTLLPNLNAVNDPRMGTMSKDSKCLTCQGDMIDCPGHFGHIELACPVYHVGLIDQVRKILKVVCFNCSRLLIDDPKEKEKIASIQYPKQRFFKIMQSVETAFRRKCDPQSDGCGSSQPKYSKKSLQIFHEYFDNDKDKVNPKMVLQADEAYQILSKITKDDQLLMGILRPENLIIKRLAVAPPSVRPAVSMGSFMKSEDDLTYSYQAIIKNNNLLKQQIEKGGNQTTINELTTCLQYYVATLMDNSIAGQPVHKQKSGKPLKAIRERLKGKEGRLRGNLMGKRVDFSARSVITPDPSLALDQLGVPYRVAVNMTVPETVTIHNIDEMRQLVTNGPDIWPGAKYIQRADGRLIDLSVLKMRSDVHIEPGYIVERHLKDGDYVIFNRQPSLHKMSTMGHRIKILPFSTFRLNLSVTSPYNADFDGDEMNMFVPQSYEARAEVQEIMYVPKQIVSPQSNKPVMGIVQDSLLGIMLFTKRETFLNMAQVMQMIMHLEGNATDNVLKILPPPAIIRPKPLWTGKQIMSLIIPDVNMIRGQTSKDGRTDYVPIREKMVLIQRGEFLVGEFTKAIVGASSGGLVHIIWKESGPIACSDFLSSLQKIINCWLVDHGFSVGIQDAVSSIETKKEIAETLKNYKRKVAKIINQAQSGTLQCQPGKNMIDSFEASVNHTLNEARDQSGNLAFKYLGAFNKIQNMVSAGSKGTNINISQIMACVGQQNVEGKRIPFGFGANRSLPHFSRHDYGPESKGFVESNYISGLDPTEFYFHAMGGREGLIDTAVKTSETGYIQRRLVKALEDVMVRYDSTVRNSHGGIVQFIYGEDGMAGEAIEDLRIESLRQSDSEIKRNFHYQASEEFFKGILNDNIISQTAQDLTLQGQIDKEHRQILADRDQLRDLIPNGDDFIHLPVNIQRLIMSCRQIFDLKTGFGPRGLVTSDLKPQFVINEVNKLCEYLTVFPGNKNVKTDRYLIEANQNATNLLRIYIRQSLASKRLIVHERFTTQSFEWLVGEIKSRFESALVHPGEVVGSIAAHSLGEPATQMTLNTFHFAGVSSKNVTLGVPRLKEIINVAKNIKTPVMHIYLPKALRKSEETVMKIQGSIEFTTMMDLVDQSQIFYDPDPKNTIVTVDQQLLDLYNEVQVPSEGEAQDINSPWLLRFVLSQQKMLNKQIEIDFIEQKLSDSFGDMIQVMHSDTNADQQVLRLRFRDLRDGDNENAVYLLRECEYDLLNEILLKGIPEITKVYAKKYSETEYGKGGAILVSDDNWMLETDGVCLKRILCEPLIDSTRTISNDILEIKTILGTEAARQSLLNELRNVLCFYGIYINYRHLACLCDVMVQKGRLTSITRHGINRLDTGPLRKCSFEETVEILLEASIYGEKDKLQGVTENVIMGQMAPIGTGAFDLVVDFRMLSEHAKDNQQNQDELDGAGTPVMYDEAGNIGGGLTPCVENTPYGAPGGRNSEYGTPYGAGGSSQYEAAFSPGLNMMASPAYGSPNVYAQSPAYGSPASPAYGNRIKVQSPIYNHYASPIYNANSDALTSPTNMQSPRIMNSGGLAQSPNYSPNSRQSPYNQPQVAQIKSNYSPSYSPSMAVNSPGSPNYSPQASMKSPNYSPSIPAAYSIQSPNYSPSSFQGQQQYGSNPSLPIKTSYSPSYSPSSFQYKSPAYSPNTGGASPRVAPEAPNQVAYMPRVEKSKETAYNPASSPQYKQEKDE